MRFVHFDLWRGFWKSLRKRDSTPSKPDIFARAVVVFVPIILGTLVLMSATSFRAPGALLTGTAILAGGFITSFTHLSTLRLRLTERADSNKEAEQSDRDLLDEVATLLLCATLVAVATSVALVVGIVLGDGLTIVGLWAAVIAALSTLLVLLFILTIPRLYYAYLQINHVRDELNGSVGGR